MVATIQTKWKHNPGCVVIMAQKHLDRRDRFEPSYEYFTELMSRVSGGARRPQLTQSVERPAYTYRRGVDAIIGLNAILST